MQTKVMTVRLALAAIALFAMAATARAQEGAVTAGQADTVTSARPSAVPLKASAQDGILVFASPDGMFKWWLDVRVNLDGTFFIEDKNSLGDGVFLRRARFAVKTILWRDYYAEFDADFAAEAVAMKDAYIRYDNVFNRTGWVKAGNFKSPFGLEELTSSRYLMFVERSMMVDAFAPGRKMGFEVAKWSPRWRVAAGVFGPDVSQYETTNADESFNYIGRANANFLRTENTVVHVGVAGASIWPEFEANTLRFKDREEYDLSNYKYLDTDNIPNVNRYELVDGEIAAQHGRLRVQAEQTAVRVRRTLGTGAPDLNFGGGYVCASYFLTRDKYPYEWKAAQFQKVIPHGRCGALELATRYSTNNLNDGDVHGGKASTFTVGLNFYPNPNIKWMLDYVMVNNDNFATAKGSLVGNDDYKMVEFRFAAAF